MQLSSKIYEADSISAVQELYHSNGWTDGLPIVPPTEDAVRALSLIHISEPTRRS